MFDNILRFVLWNSFCGESAGSQTGTLYHFVRHFFYQLKTVSRNVYISLSIFVSWDYFVEFYEELNNMQAQTAGLRLLYANSSEIRSGFELLL